MQYQHIQKSVNLNFDTLLQQAEQTSNPQELIPNFFQILQYINGLGTPLKFTKNSQQKDLSMLVIGEIGNGKSTLLNHLLYQYTQKQNLPYKTKQDQFLSGKNSSSVTQEVSSKVKGDFTLIDTPGTNDPKQELTDAEIARKIHDYLNNIIYKEGLSGITQCIMLDPSGRIRDTSIRSMSRTLLSFTNLYPGFQIGEGPRINVVFTNFSIYQQDNDDCGLPVSDDENEQQQQDDNQQSINELIQKYKQLLVNQSIKELKDMTDINQLKKNVDKLFPKENFYAFKTGNKEAMKLENQQIHKILDDNRKHGKWVISKDVIASFEPIQMEYEMRDQIQEHIADIIQFCQSSLQQAKQQFISCSGGKSSEKIEQQLEVINNILKGYTLMVKKCPCSLQKCPLILTQFLQKTIQRLSIAFGQISAEEIGKYNKEMAKQFDKKQQQLQKKIDQQQNVMNELKNQMQKEAEEFNQKMEQQKKYNEEMKKQHQQQLENIESDFNHKMELQKREGKFNEQKLKEEMSQMKQQHEQAIQNLDNNLQQRLQQERQQIQQQYESQIQELRSESKRRDQQHREEMEEMKKQKEEKQSSNNGIDAFMLMTLLQQQQQQHYQPQQYQPQSFFQQQSSYSPYVDYSNQQSIQQPSMSNISSISQSQSRQRKTFDVVGACQKCGKQYKYGACLDKHTC